MFCSVSDRGVRGEGGAVPCLFLQGCDHKKCDHKSATIKVRPRGVPYRGGGVVYILSSSRISLLSTLVLIKYNVINEWTTHGEEGVVESEFWERTQEH